LLMRSSASAAFVSQCSSFASECSPSYCNLQPWVEDQKHWFGIGRWRKRISICFQCEPSSSAVLVPTSITFFI
jgi:hypothetical protein